MYKDFLKLIKSEGTYNTSMDGDCFFDTLQKITGLYTKREWRKNIAKRMLDKKHFTYDEYKQYIQSKKWADYDIVFESVRMLNHPFCIVQLEEPNNIMLIRPIHVDWIPKDILYLVYDNGMHFTSFKNPFTPPELINRFKSVEKNGLKEEDPESELEITHGKLVDLLNKSDTKSPVSLLQNTSPIFDHEIRPRKCGANHLVSNRGTNSPITDMENWLKKHNLESSPKKLKPKPTPKPRTRKTQNKPLLGTSLNMTPKPKPKPRTRKTQNEPVLGTSLNMKPKPKPNPKPRTRKQKNVEL